LLFDGESRAGKRSLVRRLAYEPGAGSVAVGEAPAAMRSEALCREGGSP
jgi:hypothetical protein